MISKINEVVGNNLSGENNIDLYLLDSYKRHFGDMFRIEKDIIGNLTIAFLKEIQDLYYIDLSRSPKYNNFINLISYIFVDYIRHNKTDKVLSPKLLTRIDEAGKRKREIDESSNRTFNPNAVVDTDFLTPTNAFPDPIGKDFESLKFYIESNSGKKISKDDIEAIFKEVFQAEERRLGKKLNSL